MIKRAALTPTDLLHVSGEFTEWNTESSRQALNIFLVIFGKPMPEMLAMARTAVTRRLFEEIIRKKLNLENSKLHEIPADWAFLLDKAFSDDGVGLGVKMTLRRPLVAIGAPARMLVSVVGEHLQTKIVIPEHAEVANAVGAIGSEVVVREEIIIRPGGASGYTLHGAEECLEFNELEMATQKAVDMCREQSRRKAAEAGAVSPRLAVTHHDQTGSVADGSRIFLERHVTAVASGQTF
jgi:N-methylhydantoinase A/oxoprolinase/acetone carboxylase beta subunit